MRRPFYVLRYAALTPLNRRVHAATLGRWLTWYEAADELEQRANKKDLEVVIRELETS